MSNATLPAFRGVDDQKIKYRAITMHTDGRIIHVRDIQAESDAEAILIVTARGSDIRTDLWNDRGLIRRFGSRDPQ